MKRLFLIGLLGLALQANTALAQGSQQEWKGTWATAEEAPLDPWDYPKESLSNRSVRQIIHVSIGGESLRLLISNEFGSSSVDIKSVYIANAGDMENIDAKSAKYLTFNGKKNITLEPGQKVFCDDLAYSLKPLQKLSITVCYGSRTPDKPTTHRGSRTTSYIMKGESQPKAAFVVDEKLDHWYNIASLDVKADHDTRVIAALGNSITDGRGTTTNLQNRWTDFLAETYEGTVGVLNLGIGGNCVVEGGLSQPAIKRFDRDILAQRGVKTLVIFEGVNDIGGANGNAEAKAAKLIESYEMLIEKAHGAGMKVYMATITPFKGNSYYGIWHEAARKYVNSWIREKAKVEGVIDFDAVARDPQDPEKLRAEFSDDWLHLNPKGYEAMGQYAAKIIK